MKKIQFKKFKFKKPDISGSIQKLKNLRMEDIKDYWKMKHERRERILEERRNSEFSRKMAPYYRLMNRFSLLLHAIWAILINFIIEALSRHSLIEAWDYMTESPLVFSYNAFMIFVTFTVVYLVRRRVFARIIISVVWLFLGVCNGIMLLKRVTPFNAQDLKTFKEGLSLFTNYFSPFELIMIAVGVSALLVWGVAMWRRGGQYEGKMHRLLALAGVIVSFGAYSLVTDLAVENRVVSTYFGNIAFAYEDYGLPYCFAASLFNTGISQPNDYNEDTIQRISNNGELTESTADTDVMPNVLFVQLESFFDTSEYEALQTSMDPLPNLREMFEEYSSGYFKVPSVGAGTANTEFEVLTGMNLRYFGPGEYPYKTVLKNQTAESAATAFAEFGYGTHAIHNNGGNFYSRAKVFNNIGFDTFTSKEFMNILQLTENGWAKDDILLTHIADALDSTEQQDFVFTISVQGHGNYPETKLIENPRITVNGMETEEKNNAWEYYVNQVYEMDQFAGNLVKMMEERGEPTVIVFYGDHLPTMGLEAKDLKSRYLYNTNYVIWDNLGLEKQDRNIPAYQIMADVMERLELHSGTVFNYHQQRRKTKDYLLDLELLQYDILYGKQYVYEGELPITEGHMEMGIKEVTLTGLNSNLNGSYSLYGTNFTKWSKVYINGEKQKSTFLNNTRIELPESKLEEGDIITVSQVGSSNTIFRTSAEYIWMSGNLLKYTDELKQQLERDQGTTVSEVKDTDAEKEPETEENQ
ncbi:LTA synthase family protein [Fusicatenibacter saccharivorans]|uniref:LTA synthase family protein n=1 Tax=Fusicatenibacter saccharivorans TaxID=1150298 RepID=UPI002A9B0A09|nr:sulfatase-like hydrolase/transferase [bacterium]MDY5457253.1 sulfatase-like hydrolase/transferase [Bariatricus sp.]